MFVYRKALNKRLGAYSLFAPLGRGLIRAGDLFEGVLNMLDNRFTLLYSKIGHLLSI